MDVGLLKQPELKGGVVGFDTKNWEGKHRRRRRQFKAHS